MNCQGFENVVNELARDQIMEATAREEALLHSSSCESCSVRFDEERALTQNLRELSAAMRSATASAQVEETLRAEFRSHRLGRSVSRRSSWRHSWPYAAAAAVLVVICGVAAIRWNAGQQSKPGAETVAGIKNPDSSLPKSAVSPDVPAPKKKVPTVRRPKRESKLPPKPPASLKGLQRPKNLEAIASAARPPASDRYPEVATEFLPIGYSSALNVQDGGQVVRVELPRSAMARFGLPVNMDRYDERVKADVLVSADGFARAIRFVQ
jgi:hypothetical protein